MFFTTSSLDCCCLLVQKTFFPSFLLNRLNRNQQILNLIILSMFVYALPARLFIFIVPLHMFVANMFECIPLHMFVALVHAPQYACDRKE